MEILDQLESDANSWLCSATNCGAAVSIEHETCSSCGIGTKEAADELAESCDLRGKFPVNLGRSSECYLELVDDATFTLVFKNFFDGVSKVDVQEDEHVVEEGMLHIVGSWERNDRFLSLLVKDLKEVGSADSRNGLVLRISDFVRQGDAAPIVPDGCESLHCNVSTAPIYLWFYIQSPVQLLSRMLVREDGMGAGRDRSCDMLWVFGPKEH